MLTVGQSIQEFLEYLEQQGHSKNVLTRLSGVLKKQFLWEVFCLIPQQDYVLEYHPFKGKEGKSKETLVTYERNWRHFQSFLTSSTIIYLTMGDAVQAFFDSIIGNKYAPHTYNIIQTSVKLLGREYASNLPLSVIDGRITKIIMEHGKQTSNYSRRSIHRFLRFLQEKGYLNSKLFKQKQPKWKQEISVLMESSSHYLEPQTPFSECLGPYFRYCIDAKNLTEEGLKSQYDKLTFFSRWLGSVSLESIDLDQVEQYLIYLQEERKNGLAALKYVAVIIKSFFSFLFQEGILPENPVLPLRVKQPQTLNREVLTLEELTKLLDTARQLDRKANGGSTERIKTFLAARDIAILEVLAHTGIRSNELRSLMISNVNMKSRSIDITGKGSTRYYKKERRVYIEREQTKQALLDYLAVRPAEFGPVLFPSKNGKPLKSGDLSKILTRYVKAAGIFKHITPHDLRATFASTLLANGVDPLTLKVLMGHESISTTLKSYVSLEQEQLREIWKKSNPLAQLPPRKGGDSE